MQPLLEIFLNNLTLIENKPFSTLASRCFAGVSFLYVELEKDQNQSSWEQFLMNEAQQLIKNTVWRLDLRFFRSRGEQLVYRIRFLAPNSKSFCCGNQCPDCILLKGT